MARMARAVAAGAAHHVIQRGNRRQQTFFGDDDYAEYLKLMAQWCGAWDVEIWAYCLMPNHVHLIAVPARAETLARGVAEAHRRYTRYINFREGWRGYLWQGRFKSFIMSPDYMFTAARYIELNPVRAGLVERPEDWPWSSARAHLSGRDDALVKAAPLLERSVFPWRVFLDQPVAGPEQKILRRHERSGRPLGPPDFITALESQLSRPLRPQNPGPKPQPKEDK
jgi:putative transposase